MSPGHALRHLATAGLLLAGAKALPQSVPAISAASFSDGVHPCFDVDFPDADERTVSSFWKAELHSISVKVANKKELVGETARIPAATPDTLRILIKVEKPKGASATTAHIAFLTTSGFVTPDSPQRLIDGCNAWVQQGTLNLRRQVAQRQLDLGERDLARQQQRLDDLAREKQRAQDAIRKAAERTARATQEKADAAKALAGLAASTPEAADSLAASKAAKEMAKEEARLRDRIKRAESTMANATKKTGDLQWAIKKNDDDQAAQQKAVARQQDAVKSLRDKLQAIQ